MKKLIIITRRFPYFNTETFLESEIGILAGKFKEIEIYPLEINDTQRKLPSNVKVSHALVQGKKTPLRILKFLGSKLLYGNLLNHFSKLFSVRGIKGVLIFSIRQLLFEEKLKNIYEEFSNSIIYTYWFSEPTVALIKARDKGEIQNSIILTRAHRYDLYEGQDEDFYLFWPYRQYALDKIDAVFSISNNGKLFLENKYKTHGNIFVSRLGVFDYGGLSVNSNDESLNIVSAAWVSKRKRIDYIFENILRFSKNNSIKIKWDHFGDGPDYSVLKSKINSIELPSSLQITLHGRVKNTDIYDFYSSNELDVFINLSTSEGVPVSIMEAQSFGVACIATNVGATSEIINENTGVLVSNYPSIEEIQKAMKFLKDNKFSPDLVKNEWNNKYEANSNFSKFGDALISYCNDKK